MAIAGAATLLAPIPSSQADYSGPIHSQDEIKRFVEYHGPVPTRNIVTAWRQDFLGEPPNRAFVITGKGGFVSAWNASSPEAAIDAAMKNCRARVEREQLGTDCQLYAVNTKIVYPGLEFELPKLDIAIGDFTFRNQYIFYGPQRAKGVIIWSHGVARKCQVQYSGSAYPFVNRFNLAGWDILRFDRDPCYDTDISYALSKLNKSVPMLHEAGYRLIILAGQSRGAWQSLEAMRQGKITSLIDGVISISAAQNGQEDAASLRQPDQLRQILNGIDPTPARLAVIFFTGDPFNPAADREALNVRTTLSEKHIKNLAIYEDDPEILNQASEKNGHFGAGGRKFTQVYSDCLIHFIETGEKTGMCARY